MSKEKYIKDYERIVRSSVPWIDTVDLTVAEHFYSMNEPVNSVARNTVLCLLSCSSNSILSKTPVCDEKLDENLINDFTLFMISKAK